MEGVSSEPQFLVCCPMCGGRVVRVRRNLVDRLRSLFRQYFRYRCRTFSCAWEGCIPVDS